MQHRQEVQYELINDFQRMLMPLKNITLLLWICVSIAYLEFEPKLAKVADHSKNHSQILLLSLRSTKEFSYNFFVSTNSTYELQGTNTTMLYLKNILGLYYFTLYPLEQICSEPQVVKKLTSSWAVITKSIIWVFYSL